MEVITNDALVNRRARIGRIASLAGMGILVAGLVASFNQAYIYISMAALILGFLISQIGSANLTRWGRKPRADEVLVRALKGLDRKTRLYNYFLPASHVLITPTGLFVLTVKSQGGQIFCRGKSCRRKMSVGRVLLLFGQEPLGQPASELEIEMQKLAKYIGEKLPDITPTIRGAVVFSDPKVELQLDNPSATMLEPKQLKAFVRRPGETEKYLVGEERRRLVELFDQVAAQATPAKAA